ncbi:actin-like ATPase domain-containing protein [Wilcoxina mikolae CBS 423.85]|nr:actin-like ATPase domain-containing protein [Wilcoxina mikolae CBS 423.85]
MPTHEHEPQGKLKPTKDRIIVGIDFGTTHSAIAWAHTSTPDEYEVITQWPGQSGKDWGKVPSDISYNTSIRSPTPSSRTSDPTSDPTSPSSPINDPDPQTFKWGFEVPPTDPQKLSWIKILLDPSQPRPTFVQPKRTTLPRGKSPVAIVTDYLRALRAYTLLTLQRRLGAEALTNTPVEYVLTVPAVWSDKARATTLEAAIAAGLGEGGLNLITEPEGAAEYALRSLRPNALKEGDCFTVCDAGGGTVDLITYTISSLHPLQLHEVAVGTGALCGAVYLDRRFEEFVAEKIGREQLEGMDHRAKFQMGQYWETYMKREFSAAEDTQQQEEEEDFWVPVMGVQDSEDGRMRGGFLRVSRAEVKEIFEPIVRQVLELLGAQVLSVLKTTEKSVGAILLVGGFGSSEYLYRRILAWAGGSIPVLQPRNAWTAVVRGAIIRGLQGDTIAARLSRRFYGVVHDARYDAQKHAEMEKRWHDIRCEWIVRNRIQWYIRRGDVTTSSRKISFPFYRTIPASEISGSEHALKTELWVCDADTAPDKRDNTVRKLCVMLSEPISVEKFVKMRNEKGDVFYRVDYTLDMTVTGGVVVYEMSLQGKKGREKVGRVEVTYE